MDTEESSRPNPPYIPLMTLDNFIGKLKATVVPPVIDSSLTQSMSGGMSGALMSALRFLGLIEQGGKVRAPLKDLVAAHKTEKWKAALVAVITPAYKNIVGDLDLMTATPAMLEERFRTNGKCAGQVLEKAVRFYLAALTATDQSISPLLKGRKPRNSGIVRKASRTTRKGSDETPDETQELEEETPPGMRKLRLPVPGKHDLVFMVPEDMTPDDWKFIKPIFEQYVERMLNADLLA